MTDYVKAWQCIGCGRIESQANCIGICQDRLQNFVTAGDHEAVLAQLDKTQQEVQALARIVRQLAWSSPRDGEWERSYRALQAKARDVMHNLDGNTK